MSVLLASSMGVLNRGGRRRSLAYGMATFNNCPGGIDVAIGSGVPAPAALKRLRMEDADYCGSWATGNTTYHPKGHTQADQACYLGTEKSHYTTSASGRGSDRPATYYCAFHSATAGAAQWRGARSGSRPRSGPSPCRADAESI